ncbi:MAG: hypothetical protein JNK85_27100 [Verrucomicrobiales bacterium]|nr:hypothetical protein [Verrucomicrobiales bacterium]
MTVSLPSVSASDIIVVGLSSKYRASDAGRVGRVLGSLILERSVPGTSIEVWDSEALVQVGAATVPQLTYDSAAAKARHPSVAPLLASLDRFLRAASTNVAEDGYCQGRITEFLAAVARNPRYTHSRSQLRVMLAASPLFASVSEPKFSMLNGMVPADWNIAQDRKTSPYGTKDLGGILRGARLAWWDLGTAYCNGAHQVAVGEWWSSYIAALGGVLQSLGPDSVSCLDSLLFGTAGDAVPTRRTLPSAPSPNACFMVDFRTRPAPSWLTSAASTRTNRLVPVLGAGPGQWKVGISWRGSSDFDLYVRPERGGAEVNFRNPRAGGAHLDRDVRAGSGTEFEFVEFLTSDIKKADMWVNLFSARERTRPIDVLVVLCSPEGQTYPMQLRWEHPIPDSGRSSLTRERSASWKRLDASQILSFEITR